MTRRDLIVKWAVYALGLVPVWLLDGCILPRYPIFGVIPMLLPIAVAAVAVLEGAHAGAGFGLGVGLLWALAYPGGVGSRVILMALAGMAVGAISQYALNQSLPGCIICSAGVLGVMDGFQVLKGLVTNAASLPAMLQVAIPEWLVSMAWTPVIYLLFRMIFRRVGGAKLA